MKIISSVVILLLKPGNALIQDKEELKHISHDMVDEAIEDVVEELHTPEVVA
jgi:hypothetical protein